MLIEEAPFVSLTATPGQFLVPSGMCHLTRILYSTESETGVPIRDSLSRSFPVPAVEHTACRTHITGVSWLVPSLPDSGHTEMFGNFFQ